MARGSSLYSLMRSINSEIKRAEREAQRNRKAIERENNRIERERIREIKSIERRIAKEKKEL